MSKDKVATGLKIGVVLVALAIIHALGKVLSNIFLVSDVFTVVGALATYKYLTDSKIRFEVSESVADTIDLNSAAEFLVEKVGVLSREVVNSEGSEEDPVSESDTTENDSENKPDLETFLLDYTETDTSN